MKLDPAAQNLLIGLFLIAKIFELKNHPYFKRKMIKYYLKKFIKNKNTIEQVNRMLISSITSRDSFDKDYIGEVTDLDSDFFLLTVDLNLSTNKDIARYYYALYVSRLLEIHDYIINLPADRKSLALYKNRENMVRKGHGLISNNDQLLHKIDEEIDELKFS